MKVSLSIVIPAYKGKFLGETLRSLAEQNIKDFNVYIGDDASPEDLFSIVKPFQDRLPITFKRFDKNEGRDDLTSHWMRCMEMTRNEPWIWLLPDDDFASPECVEVFFDAALKDMEDKKLYRFQTSHIDASGRLIFQTPVCPPLESNVAFLINKLQFKRSSSVAEYIFSRQKFYEVGGFPSLPLAWGSDDWLWIKLSADDDIVTLPKGRVFLRQSDLNISANSRDYTSQKFDAKYQFLEMVFSNEHLMQKLEQQGSKNELRKLISEHLFFEYKSYQLHFSGRNLLKYAARNNRIIGGGLLRNIYRLLLHELRNG